MNLNGVDPKLDKEVSAFVQCFERVLKRKPPFTLFTNHDVQEVLEECQPELKALELGFKNQPLDRI